MISEDNSKSRVRASERRWAAKKKNKGEIEGRKGERILEYSSAIFQQGKDGIRENYRKEGKKRLRIALTLKLAAVIATLPPL